MTTIPSHDALQAETEAVLARLGVKLQATIGTRNGALTPAADELIARSPVTGGELARIAANTRQ